MHRRWSNYTVHTYIRLTAGHVYFLDTYSTQRWGTVTDFCQPLDPSLPLLWLTGWGTVWHPQPHKARHDTCPRGGTGILTLYLSSNNQHWCTWLMPQSRLGQIISYLKYADLADVHLTFTNSL